jgi:hypothetical protein
MPLFQGKEVGPDAHIELESAGIAKPANDKAHRLLTTLGEGQEEWVRKAIVNLCKGKRADSQLYDL